MLILCESPFYLICLPLLIGGHQSPDNAFHAAYACGTYKVNQTFDDSVLRLSTQPATVTSPNLLVLTNGKALVPATDSSTKGYDLEFKAPAIAGNNINCVIALLDQRNWGGCIDVTLVQSGSGTSTTVESKKSTCQTYCDMMSKECTGANAQFPAKGTNLDCMTSCANYTQVSEANGLVYSGDNLQCRMKHVEYVASKNDVSHCAHAAPSGSVECFQSIADGTRAPSMCFRYCNAIASKCSGSNYFTSTNACMSRCATWLTFGLGSDQSKGNNAQCRLAAAEGGRCGDANPTGTGECAVANPLLLAADTVSAVYTTQSGMCDTPLAAASNTISGCCCVSGTLTVIHVKGSKIAEVTSNLTVSGGQMCQSGFQSIPNAADTTKPNSNYTFASPVIVDQFSFYLRQTDAGSTDVAGRFNIGPDPFTFQLVDGLLVITNDAPSDRAPRVCSIQAKASKKIDTTGYAIPVDPLDDNSAPPTASSSLLLLVMLAFATLFARSL